MKTTQCIFCGVFGSDSPGDIFSIYEHDLLFQVECSNCGARGPSSESKEKAMDAISRPYEGYSNEN